MTLQEDVVVYRPAVAWLWLITCY